ncbi:ATP/GTP-binding protein [Streptomyces sp. HPF1205]|uniref:GTP-binding protein n=1 Tax=Streptomyces sp. HPF1205 TaxID=2873262 RepID=UPI001CEC2640|nr:ATP/GTP-binding protein [Streptomyces sp. HPF1205]
MNERQEGPVVTTADPPSTAAVKIIVAGGFGAGKTTLVTAVSEIRPLTTEEELTLPSSATDDLAGVEGKTTTTVAVDFGRITFPYPDMELTLYLFGTPGQDRFLFLWHGLAEGAIGAVVLADTRRLDDSFPSLTYFEQLGLPFIVAVNEFEGCPYRYTPDEVRDALDLPPHIPVVLCDARDRASATDTLIALVHHALGRLPSFTPAATPSRLGAPA